MSEYDLRVISLGAGVQSSAMYLMACEGILTPRPDVAIFADTQDESDQTYRWLKRLEQRTEIPIVRATAGSLSTEVFRSMRETKSGFVPIPTYVSGGDGRESMGRRQCTRSHKTDVVYKEIRRQLGLQPHQRSGDRKVEVWIGISVDEAHRAKPSRYPMLEHRWPLLYDLPKRRGELMGWLESEGCGLPPKSSCVYCPFRSDRDWISMKRDDPVAFERAVSFEREMREIDPRQFIHDSCTPLEEVGFEADRTLDLFGNECEGVCGV